MLTALLLSVLLQVAGPAARPAAISGQVVMSDGSPAAAVRVAAIPAPPGNILPMEGQNYYSAQLPASVALTDAQGRYRLTNIPPGRYFIVAGLIGYATFHPATTDINAATVLTLTGDVAPGDINLKLATWPGARVSGQVSPAPAAGVQERATLAGVTLGELLETPIRPDGTFEFGRVPRGDYVLSVSPTPPGLASVRFTVGDEDVTALRVVRPPVRTVTGRIVADNGPLPFALLAFETPQSHVSGRINPDGTFTVQLHAARHQVHLAGMPVGYSVASIRAGAEDLTERGVTVGDRDLANVLITVRAPRQLPRLTGRVAGVSAGAPGPLQVELTGPFFGRLSGQVRGDGTFEFPALPPGMYIVSLPQVTGVAPLRVVVGSAGAHVEVGK